MESQQMMELLLKEIRANQAKAEADREERKVAQVKADANLKEKMKMMHANQAKAETRHKDFLARMDADWKAWREIMNANQNETMACQEMEAHQEVEPTSVDRKPEAAEQREVPVDDAEVMLVGELKKKRCRD
jgi:hypothetical protein